MSNTRKAAATRPKTGLTFAQVKARIQRPQRTAEVVLDAAAAAEIDALETVLDRLRSRDGAAADDPMVRDVAEQLQEAERRADASRVPFTLEAISHLDYRALLEAHPPGARQAQDEKNGAERWPFDPDTFAPALVQAQLISPKPAGDEEFDAFWADLSDGQIRHLWETAFTVQMQITAVGPRSLLAAEVLGSPPAASKG